jgi:glycosyltransferase involved in cell wall biosynthesis
MKVVILSKALIVGTYQRKLEEIAAQGVELTALVPPSWHEPRVGTTMLDRRFTRGYNLEVLPIWLNGQHHLHFYGGLRQVLQRLRPAVLHIDEESFNLATYLAMRAGRAVGARCCFYNWANIDRRYPLPFSYFERYNLRHACHAIAGNQEAATIIRRHGFRGPISVIPQFGVDETMFAPVLAQHAASDGVVGTQRAASLRDSFTVGFLGRLVVEKGVLDLVEALAGLPNAVRLVLIGDGVLRGAIEQRARALGLAERIVITGSLPSTAIPEILRGLDVLALPSHTRPNWKEQFGRALIEAMSSGVAVVGSDSGEIPNVIGDAGMIVPEGNVAALREAIARLYNDRPFHAELCKRGRRRVLEHFTQTAIARRHVAVYHSMLEQTIFEASS